MGELNCYHETFGPLSLLGRKTMAEVVLTNRLRAAIEKLNPGLSPNAIEIAVQEVTKDRSVLRANQVLYQLFRNGVKVTYKGTSDSDQEETVEIVNLIDWNEPEKNEFLLISQFLFPVTTAGSVPILWASSTASSWVHRTKSFAQEPGTGLRDEPVRLQRHDSASVLVQRRRYHFQWLQSKDR